MICPKCRDQNHQDCRGGTWCACQHKTRVLNLPVTSSAATGFAGPEVKPRRARKTAPRTPKP